MKRAATTPDDKGKRAKRSLEFLGTCLSTVHLLSDSTAWKAAKAAAASGDVQVLCVQECPSTSNLCIQGSVTAPSSVSKAAAAAHTHPFQGEAQVQLLLDTCSGELLDADTSCCPGGYHVARGSFCPCVGGLLLAAVQLQSLEHGEQQELGLPHWTGTDAPTARQHAGHMTGKLQQLMQPGLLQQAPAQLLQEVEEVEVLPATQVQAKLRADSGYGSYNYGNGIASPDVIPHLTQPAIVPRHAANGQVLFDVACDLPQQTPARSWQEVRAAMAAAAAPSQVKRAAAAAAAGQNGRSNGVPGPLDRAQLVAALGGSHLTTYMGKQVSGWQQRPKVINWAFGLLVSAAASSQPDSSAAGSSSSAVAAGSANAAGASDAKPLAALTGLMRVLWHSVYVGGIPADVRAVLLVAMALRNLLLVVALPVWVRKGVAAQLRAWRQDISEQQACNPVKHTGVAKLVHLLRVFKEAEQLCQRGWDHPALSGTLGSLGSSSVADPNAAQQQLPLPASRQQALQEHPGLLLLRLTYLELLGEQAAYVHLAMDGQQWSQAVSALLRSGDRSQLRLAAELLPRHISALSQRLEYMQQLLGLEELGVVERCELAARLLLSFRGGLIARTQQPLMGGSSRAWWQVTVWEVPPGAPGALEVQDLQSQLGSFLKDFFKLAGQAQFNVAKEALAARDAAEGTQAPAAAAGAGGGAGVAAAAAAAAAGSSAAQPSAAAATAAAPPAPTTVATPEELALMINPMGLLKLPVVPHDPLATSHLRVNERLKVMDNPTRPLEFDAAMAQFGEPSCRIVASTAAGVELDERGFVKCCTGGLSRLDMVEPFPLPNLLPLCGLAPAALHAVVEGAMAPLFDATFRPSTTSGSGTASLGSSRPGDLADALLHVAGHPGVEYGGPAVRLQMAVEMVSYWAALTPIGCLLAHDGKEVCRPLLWGLLGMGQRDLASTVAMAAYRTFPGRFTATYLLLLAIQRGPEAQAAAVDWILGRDWPQAAQAAQEEGGLVDLTGASPRHSPAPAEAGDTSSLDTQQLLGCAAAAAVGLADTASSRVKQNPAYQAARARERTAKQRAAAGGVAGVPAGGGNVPANLVPLVESLIREYVEDAQDCYSASGFDDLLADLTNRTGLPQHHVEQALEDVQSAIDQGERLIYTDADSEDYGGYGYGYGMSDDDEDWHEHATVVDPRIHVAALRISALAREPRQPPAAAAPARAPGVHATGGGSAAKVQAASAPTLAATLVLEHELLGATGAGWRERAILLRKMPLPLVIQYAASCGLAPDQVSRLALVALGVGPEAASTAARTWDTWLAQSRSNKRVDEAGALTRPPQGMASTSTVELSVAPGVTIQKVTADYTAGCKLRSDVFAAWLLRWLQSSTSGAHHGSSGGGSNPGSSSDAGASRPATLLRQLWLLLNGRCYDPWMLWLAAALAQTGEPQLACEAAAQGLLPTSCSYWGIQSIQKVYTACFATLLPHLAQSSNPAVLQQAAATQLLMAQLPVPAEMLLGEGVLERLLFLSSQLAACNGSDGGQGQLKVPSSCMDPDTGRMSFPTGNDMKSRRTTLHACSQFMCLLQRCVLAPLGAHIASKATSCSQQGQQQQQQQPGQQQLVALRAASSPEEETVVALLESAVATLHWSMQLCIARAAREVGVICSWPALLRLVSDPLAAAAEAFSLATSQESRPTCTSLAEWRAEHSLNLPALVTKHMEQAGGWVNGVLAWVTVELGVAVLDTGNSAIQPPPNCVEEISSRLLGYFSPHVVPYAAAAMKAMQGHSAADITRALVPNGVLPVVGRPENLQASSTAGGARSPYWAWGEICYTQALHCLLKQPELLSSLPPATIKNMAVTYWVKCGTLEAMAWVGQLLDWLQQRAGGGARQQPAGAAAAAAGPHGAAGATHVQVAGGPSDVLNIQVHPELAPFLDLAPVSGPQAALQRFLLLQTAAGRQDLQGALSALFREPPAALAAHFALSPAQFHNLEQQMLQLEGVFVLLEQPPYAGSPAVRWLLEQPEFQHIQMLLRGLPPVGMMEAHLTAVTSPLLRLRVLQLRLWKLSRAIRSGPPSLQERTSKGPPKPWLERPTAVLAHSLLAPSYTFQLNYWAQLPDAALQAAFAAARADIPGPSPLPRAQMINNVLLWLQAQEVALAWAVVKYAELRGYPNVALAELRVLVQEPAPLGQLPVFMTQLGAAVKQQQSHYPLYAMFRHVAVPKDLHQYLWGAGKKARKRNTVESLQGHLDNKYNRASLQQVMLQTIPWLDWHQHTKGQEVRVLAEWLWWLAVQSQQQGVIGAHVTTDQPVAVPPFQPHQAYNRSGAAGYYPRMPYQGHPW